jgi:hypothetical protein
LFRTFPSSIPRLRRPATLADKLHGSMVSSRAPERTVVDDDGTGELKKRDCSNDASFSADEQCLPSCFPILSDVDVAVCAGKTEYLTPL